VVSFVTVGCVNELYIPLAILFQLSDKCAILIRQYGKDTLYDRLNTRPFLSLIEKRWIAFQLLKALEQCNNVNVRWFLRESHH